MVLRRFGLPGILGERPEVTVAIEHAVYAGGDTIRAVVRITGKQDFEIREARVELVCATAYAYWDKTSKGGSVQRRATDAQVERSSHLLEAGVVPAGRAAEYAVAFTLSTTAAATGVGAISAIAWRVRAVLDVPLWPDVRGELAFTVRTPREAYAWQAESAPSSDATDCALAFELASRNLLAGEAIDGALVVTPLTAFEVEAIRVELVRREDVPRDEWGAAFTADAGGRQGSPRGEGNEHEKVFAGEVVATQRQLAAGADHHFPFRLVVPAGAYPTARTDCVHVGWMLRATLNRRLYPDDHLALDVNVFNAGAG